VWQVVYEELKGQGLEMIAVAFDTGGKAAVEEKIRAADCKERPEVLARLMGWAPDLWARQAPPTYPCLIDEAHVVAELYGMVNVPQGVWIDEKGRIVRPAESAGTCDMVRTMNRETFEIPDADADRGVAIRNTYIDALRDWVKNGAASPYALPANEVKRRMRGPSEADVRAATHVRLGRYLYAKGALERAKHHFKEAVRLCPQKWNYRRQSNMLDPQSIGQLNAGPDFWAAIDALGDEQFYPVADFSISK
jgi:tetratricopeptide (TPR) repeat protein